MTEYRIINEGQCAAEIADELPQIERLYQRWALIEQRIEASNGAGHINDDANSVSDNLLDAQTVIMDLVALTPARSKTDLLYKMALWRRDTPDISPGDDHIARNDKIAYSVFRDLVAMTGETSVLQPEDTQ